MSLDVPPALSEAIQVHALWSSTLVADEKYRILSGRWWKLWSEYTQFNTQTGLINHLSPSIVSVDQLTPSDVQTWLEAAAPKNRPPPQDHSDICVDEHNTQQLKLSMEEFVDYVLVPEAVGVLFDQWYGGGPSITRSVITVGIRVSYIRHASNIIPKEIYIYTQIATAISSCLFLSTSL